MKLKSEKTRKLIFYAIIVSVAAYILYLMISYYTTEKVNYINLPFKTNENNIMTNVNVRYTMKYDEGTILVETNETTDSLSPDGKIGDIFAVKTNGNKVSEAKINITYSDKTDIDEKSIILVKIDKNGNVTPETDFSKDSEKNVISTKFSGNGMWFLADKTKLNLK